MACFLIRKQSDSVTYVKLAASESEQLKKDLLSSANGGGRQDLEVIISSLTQGVAIVTNLKSRPNNLTFAAG